MAIQECTECGGKVSSKAEKCPHCGAAVEKKTGPVGWVARGIIALFVGTFAYSCATEADKPVSSGPPKPFGSSESGALVLCEKAIKQVSRDPASAEVPWVASSGNAAEFYFVWNNATKPLRLKNGFGALLASSASCTVDSTTGRITSLTIDGKSML